MKEDKECLLVFLFSFSVLVVHGVHVISIGIIQNDTKQHNASVSKTHLLLNLHFTITRKCSDAIILSFNFLSATQVGMCCIV